MKRKSIFAALALLMTSGAASAFTEQQCEKVWSKEAWSQAHQKQPPDFTCVRITEPFLVSLQGATKAQVTKAMKVNVRPSSDKYDILHFLRIPDGGVNFQFENDKVVHIDGATDDGQFIWTPAGSFACSDLPGGHYARCNRE